MRTISGLGVGVVVGEPVINTVNSVRGFLEPLDV